MMKSPLFAFAATTFALAGSPAMAAPQGETMVVQYDDLKLTSEAGQATLENRIDAAARKFCRIDDTQTGTRMKSRSATKCYKDAKRAATKQFARLVEDARLGG